MINVLCIEDELAVADYITSLLDDKKYSVKNINDGKQALDFLLSTSEPPDIILLDNILPSLNGIEILKELKAHHKEYAIVFLTMDETLETAVMALKEGALDYLSKSKYLKTELTIKVEKAYKIYQERLKKEFYEQQISLLTLAMEQSPNSIVLTDINGNIEYVNKKFIQQTGYRSVEVKGGNSRILKAGDYPEGFFERLWQTITSGKTWNGEFKNKRKNGELFYEKAIISPIKDKSGNIVSYLAIKEDITELKNAEQALLEKTAEMDRFFTVVLDLLCIIDSTSKKFIRVNKAWANTLGYTMEELIDKPYLDFVHPDDLLSTKTADNKLTQTGRLLNFVNRYRCKDGSYKFIEWSSIANKDGTFYSSARDITERKQNEQALKESEDRFRGIFEMANAGIFFADQNGQIIMANKAFQDMVEYTAKELCNMDFSQLTHPDDVSQENERIKELIFNEIKQYRIEKRYVSKSNQTIWADLAVTVILDETGSPVSYVGVINNISERKKYEEQLKEIISAKDKFFSIISHDLRNQFASLQGLTDMLMEEDMKLTQKDKEKVIQLLQYTGRSAQALLEDLLKWSRSQINRLELVPEKMNLHEMVKNVHLVIQNQATLKQVEIVNNINETLEIVADKQMINTVLRNLINNAIKFTPTGGQIVISATTKDNFDCISVKDNGVGMPADIAKNIFRIDTKHSTPGTDKEMGTGLGLILCKEFIDKHGGEIIVESEVGKGSEFMIKLPVLKSF